MNRVDWDYVKKTSIKVIRLPNWKVEFAVREFS